MMVSDLEYNDLLKLYEQLLSENNYLKAELSLRDKKAEEWNDAVTKYYSTQIKELELKIEKIQASLDYFKQQLTPAMVN